MPRDVLAETARATEIKPDLSKPSLAGLAWLLRHPGEWQKGHLWDFKVPLRLGKCGTSGCAIGVGRLQWGHNTYTRFHDGLPKNVALIFYSYGDWPLKTYGAAFSAEVTPLMVADAIDRYLAERS